MNRKFLRSLLSIAILLFVSAPLLAQKPGPYGFWPCYYGSAAINDKWGIWGEAQYRNYDFTGDLEQLLLRTAVTYNLGPDNNQQISQGYGYVRSEPYISGTEEKRVTEEHRLYQQLILKQRFGRLYLTHRYRLEERFLPDDFRVRFRYFVSANFCLNKKALEPGTFFLTAYNEVFLHADKPVFDRNRLYAGIGYGISKSLRLEGGHMLQMQESVSRPQFQVILWHNFKI
jgi:hypothetical protein